MNKYLLPIAVLTTVAGSVFAQPAATQPAKPEAPKAPKVDAPKVDAPKVDAPKVEMGIVETAAANKDFSTLVSALKAADLVDALKGKGPFTVFAPTNAAFDKLEKGTLENLLKPENKAKLADLLKFHVIAASVPAAEVLKMKESSKTLQGSTFNIVVKDGKVSIGTEGHMANVTATDIKCSNGIIHAIDSVIMPAAKKDEKKQDKKDDKAPAKGK